MAYVRILVDGSSLLHQWTDLAPGKARLSAAAREELIIRLTRYYDATGTPITVVFDASLPDTDALPSNNQVEVLCARTGQTTLQMIERLAHRFHGQGNVLVVSADEVQRQSGALPGAEFTGCQEFVRALETTLEDIERQINQFNQEERNKFLRAS